MLPVLAYIEKGDLIKIQNYCAYQERCESEVSDKLQTFGLTEEAVFEVLRYLEKENFLNTERFVQVFVGSKLRQKKWGRIKIRNKLLQKKIAPELIERVLDKEIDSNTYLKILTDMLEKKANILMKSSSGDKYKIKQKLFLFAKSKGYTGSESMAVVEKIMEKI